MPSALVTGAGVRVGRAIALALGRAGYELALHVHSSFAPAEEVARQVEKLGQRAMVFSGDLSDAVALEQVAKKVSAHFPVLDVLVHNAGLFERGAFDTLTRAQYRKMLAVNLDAPFFLTQALLPALRAAEAPVVIHITDIGGERPVSHYAHYSVSKAGLIMLTRALAVELGPKIRVNAVSPGTVALPEGFPEGARQNLLRRTPLAKEGEPEDIARAVLFFAKDAPFATGQVLAVDGGRGVAL